MHLLDGEQPITCECYLHATDISEEGTSPGMCSYRNENQTKAPRVSLFV